MIFCDEPWYNEPGRSTNQSASLAYNKQVQGWTAKHAMLDWLNGNVDSVFGDVVQLHFATNAQAIRQTMSGWSVDYRTQQQVNDAIVGLARKHGRN
jgi:hypothetical protein